ncbi:MAG: hypothetical protein AAFX99_21655, partial [Myxococcota bacterium]
TSNPSQTPSTHQPSTLNTVAVLPFKAPADDENSMLAEGLVEDIIDTLSTHQRSIRVRPWGAVATYTNAHGRDPQTVGQELKVQKLIEGSVRRAGKRLQIRARLISVEDGFQLWAQRFDCTIDEVFDVSDTVANAIADALGSSLSCTEDDLRNPEATSLYLNARQALRDHWNGAPEDLRRVIDLFEEVLTLAPGSARTMAGAALAWARLVFINNDVHAPRALELARQATALGPNRAEPWFALSMCLFYTGQPREALHALTEAMHRAPDDDLIHELFGRILLEVDGPEIALRHFRRALRLNPRNTGLRWDHVRALALMGAWDRVDAMLAQPPSNPIERFLQDYVAARMALWRPNPVLPPRLTAVSHIETIEPVIQIIREVALTRRLTQAHIDLLDHRIATFNYSHRRLMLAYQINAELAAAGGRMDRCRAMVRTAMDAGLRDRVWLTRCPLLLELADDPDIARLKTQAQFI